MRQQLLKTILAAIILGLLLGACSPGQIFGPAYTPTPKPCDQYMEYFTYMANLDLDFDTMTVTEMETIAEQAVTLSSPDEFSEINLRFSQNLLDVKETFKAYAAALVEDAINGGGVSASFAKIYFTQAQLSTTLTYTEWKGKAVEYLAQYDETLPVID